MLAARNIARISRRLSPTTRLGTALSALSRTTARSFWDQKQSEKPTNQYTQAPEQPTLDTGSVPPSQFADADVMEPEGRRLSPYLMGLLAVGGGLSAYGLYGLYEMMTMWPTDVREDLRSGLRAKRKGDFEIAIQYMTRAWNEARAMPRDVFNEQALLKVSGIGIALANTVEEAGQPGRAFELYQEVLQYLRTAHLGPAIAKNANADLDTLQAPLSAPERYRTVALAYRLGELANKLDRPEEEEKWLVWSVEALLRLLNTPPASAVPPEKNSTYDQVLNKQLGIPVLFYQHNIAAPFEALGSFYARTGKPTYALPLYLQAISILIPTSPAETTAEDYCRGAALMGNISELIVRYQLKDGEPAEALVQAEAWANKGLELATSMRKKVSKKCEECEEAYAVLLYNMAVIRELSGDKNRARQLLGESLEQSKSMGLDEGIKLASRALESLGVPAGEPSIRSLVTDQDIIVSASLE